MLPTARPARVVAVAALALAAAQLLTSCGTAPEQASPSASPSASERSIEAVNVAEGTREGAVDVSVEGAEGVSVTFREITIPPGESTGKHCHAGQLIGVVEQGDLTHYADIYPEGVHVYRTGDAIIEGAGYPHEGRNEGSTDVVLWVTYLIPEGEPLAETDLSHCEL